MTLAHPVRALQTLASLSPVPRYSCFGLDRGTFPDALRQSGANPCRGSRFLRTLRPISTSLGRRIGCAWRNRSENGLRRCASVSAPVSRSDLPDQSPAQGGGAIPQYPGFAFCLLPYAACPTSQNRRQMRGAERQQGIGLRGDRLCGISCHRGVPLVIDRLSPVCHRAAGVISLGGATSSLYTIPTASQASGCGGGG